MPADNYGVEGGRGRSLADGRWAAFEIKLGVGLVDEGAAALLRFRESVDTRRSGARRTCGGSGGAGGRRACRASRARTMRETR